MAATRQFKGFHPYSFQKDVTDKLCFPEAKGKGITVTCKSSRQRGKSFMIANILLYYAVNFTKTKNFCVSPTLKQSKEIYKTITNAIANTGLLKGSNATDLTIKIINGSSISFKSAEQGSDSLRGFTCSGILCIDEAAFIEDEIFAVINPWVDFYRANILITSTPFIKQGFFYQYYNYGLDGLHNCQTVDWSDEKYKAEMETIMPPERLEMYRRTLPKNAFKTDYLGEWLDDDGTVFLNFSKCLGFNDIKPTDKLYVGLDWSNQGENDDTAISIFNQDGKQVLLRYVNNLTPLKQIDYIDGILKPYLKQIVVIQSELNSIGTPYSDILKNRSQIYANKVRGFDTSNTSKNAIVVKMQTALEQGDVTLLPDEKQTRQFGYFTAFYNPKTRNVSYAAPNNLHDDTVMATLIAYDAYKNGNIIGKYNLR